jgi:uncharacterized protein (TIGR02996 family)
MTIDQLRSCLARTPEDDLLWLALADRLEESGQPERAELTRLCRRLREPDEPGSPPTGGLGGVSPPSSIGGRVSSGRVASESRVRELLAGGVRPCVPEVSNSLGMLFVLIPAGSFWMGSADGVGDKGEHPRHRVTLTRAFWMGVHPVTQAQYEGVMGANPSHFSKKGRGRVKVKGMDTSAFPVENVSGEDAADFRGRLSALAGEAALGREYLLPTEAEWEYSCRGGLDSGAFHFGAWLDKSQANIDESRLGRTCAVGSYPPNAFGLYDMHGNVWEWCSDLHDTDVYAKRVSTKVNDPVNSFGEDRVLRGGSYDLGPDDCRAACRRMGAPGYRSRYCGFRLCFRLAPAV